MSHAPTLGLLTIGTEVVYGQILNRNASWISQKLDDMGFEVAFHLSVADEFDAILEGLQFFSTRTDAVVTTGGLGPTSDDLTREVIAKFVGEELFFDDSAWQRICDRLQKLDLEISSTNRQQCYFPKFSKIFENPRGTASGFACHKNGQWVLVLPGPPHEIEGMWDLHVAPYLESAFQVKPTRQLMTWQCLGVSESLLAEKINALGTDLPLVLGYRPHRPYVELKTWLPLDASDLKVKQWKNLIDEQVQPWFVGYRVEEIYEKLARGILKSPRLKIFDEATDGFFFSNLRARLPSDFVFSDGFEYLCSRDRLELPLSPHEAYIHLRATSDSTLGLKARYNELEIDKIIRSPYGSRARPEPTRLRGFFCEKAIVLLAESF